MTTRRGYAIGELLVTFAFFAIVATLAARALEIDASRPPPAPPVQERAPTGEILRRSDSLWYDPDDPIWRTAQTVVAP